MVRFVQSAIGIGMRRACCLSRYTEARARVQALFGFQALIDQAPARRLIARRLDRGRSPKNAAGWKTGIATAMTRLDGSWFDLIDTLTARRRANKHFFVQRDGTAVVFRG